MSVSTSTRLVSGDVSLIVANSFDCSGSGASFHLGLSFIAASIACCSVWQTTPTKFLSTTTLTRPGERSRGTCTSSESSVGGRTTRPWSIPLTRTSWT
jgi:hypothetical protein